MSRNNGSAKGAVKLDLKLKLNLSPPREDLECYQLLHSSPNVNSPQYLQYSSRSTTTSSSTYMTSPPSTSCMTSEMEEAGGLRYCSSSCSPEATSMILVGCPRCLMYVMLSEEDPKCPRCNSTVLLDFLKDPNNINMNKRSRKR